MAEKIDYLQNAARLRFEAHGYGKICATALPITDQIGDGACMLIPEISEAVAYIRQHTDFVPDIALTLGSGLGPVADAFEGVSIPYGEIPHFPVAQAPGHDGQLLIGTLFGRNCVAMRGRVHMYEGYSAQEVTFPLRVMHALGAEIAFFTNAAGGMRDGMQVGDFVAIEDHLSLATAAGLDPLRGIHDPGLGPRFVSLNKAYDPDLIKLAQTIDTNITRGVYGHNVGPTFEPPALIRLMQLSGCDMVGMSTVPEVIVARHADMRVFALSTITNICVSSVEDDHITNESEVFEAAKLITPRLSAFMERFLPALPEMPR